jgi:hypothetical protein
MYATLIFSDSHMVCLYHANVVKCAPVTICIFSLQGGATRLRFQPRQGKYLAAASEKGISILDAETLQVCRTPLQVGN